MSWAWPAVIALALLLAAAELRAARRLQRGVSPRRLLLDLLGLAVLALLLLPAPGAAPAPRQPLSVAVVVDVSASMASRDIHPSRLARAQQIIRRWLDKLPASRWALIPFAGEAVLQVPLTEDRTGLGFFVDQLEPGLVTAPGSAPEEALQRAAQALNGARGKRLILLLSDGERTLPEPPPDISPAIPVLTVTLGSQAGAPVLDRHGQARRDRAGNLLLTRTEPQRLQRLATVSGGLLLAADQALAVTPALRRLGLQQPQDSEPVRFGLWLPLLALLLVLLRCVPRGPVSLRSLGVAALLLVLSCSRTGGDSPRDLLQQAWQAEQQGQQATAAKLFIAAAQRLPAAAAAIARYDAATLELAAGYPEKAIPLLEAALRQRPGDADSARNLALALRSRLHAPAASAGKSSGQPHPGPAGELTLQQELLRSTALRAAGLPQPPRPQQERLLERDW